MFEGDLKIGGGPVESLAFSPSGSLLAIGHRRGGGSPKKATPALSLVDLSKSKPKPKPSCLVTTFDEDLVSSPGGWIGMVRHVEFLSDSELLFCFDGDARTITLDGRKGLPVGPKAPYTEYYDLHSALAAFGGSYSGQSRATTASSSRCASVKASATRSSWGAPSAWRPRHASFPSQSTRSSCTRRTLGA